MIGILVGFTIAGALAGVYAVRTHPTESARTKRETIATLAGFGFVVGLIVAFAAGLAETARVIE